MKGEFTFTANTVIYIIVGQKGEDTRINYEDNAAPGGGGGSFVYLNATNSLPLVAAGGGGGGGRWSGTQLHATITATANGAYAGGAGGISGNGGGVNGSGASYWAGAGAGWL